MKHFSHFLITTFLHLSGDSKRLSFQKPLLEDRRLGGKLDLLLQMISILEEGGEEKGEISS